MRGRGALHRGRGRNCRRELDVGLSFVASGIGDCVVARPMRIDVLREGWIDIADVLVDEAVDSYESPRVCARPPNVGTCVE